MQPEAQQQLTELIYQDAEQEAIAAQLIAEHWKNSPHRVLSMAEQQMQAEGFPAQPMLVKFRYWGVRAIEFNISRLWDLLWPITFDGMVVRLSIAFLVVWGADAGLDAYEAQVNSGQVQISFIQEY